jgi:hypothetical protein
MFIIYNMPVTSVASTSDLLKIDARRAAVVSSGFPPPGISQVVVVEDHFELRARAGVPLRRSAGLLALAEEVTSRRQAEKVEFSDDWVERLAVDLAEFAD